MYAFTYSATQWICFQGACLTLFIPGFFGWCSTGGGGGGVFHLHPVIPLSLKSDESNFVQNYFAVRSMDQIDNDVTMTSSLLW